jgi:hypothetical protein
VAADWKIPSLVAVVTAVIAEEGEMSEMKVDCERIAVSTQCACPQELDREQQTVKALKSGPVTRGLSNSADYRAPDPARIDLEIFFDFHSAKLGKTGDAKRYGAQPRALTNPAEKDLVTLATE